MNFSKTFLLLIAAATLFSSACSPGQKLTAEGAWIPGKTYTYRETRTTTTTVTDPDTDSIQINIEKTLTDYQWVVVRETPDKNLLLQLVFKRIQQEDDKNVYDSMDPDADSISRAKHRFIGPMIGHTFEMVMSPAGKVLDFRGMDALWESMEKDADKATRTGIRSVKGTFNDASMRTTMQLAFGFYPTKKVKTGASWKTTTHIDRLGADRKTTYTLKNRTAQQAVIQSQSVLTNDPEKPGELKMGPMTIKYFLSGTSSGIYTLDQPAALLRHSRENMTMSGTMEIKVPFLGSQKMPTIIESEIILERTE